MQPEVNASKLIFISFIIHSFSLVHTRFTTPNNDVDMNIFHFVSTKSKPIKKTFNFRIIPEDSVKIMFSQSKNIANGTVSFILKGAQTEVNSKGVKLEFKKNESYHLKTNSINDVEVLFTEKEINFHNKVILTGHFGDLHFIGFDSIKPASWIVKKSKDIKPCSILSFLAPTGALEEVILCVRASVLPCVCDIIQRIMENEF